MEDCVKEANFQINEKHGEFVELEFRSAKNECAVRLVDAGSGCELCSIERVFLEKIVDAGAAADFATTILSTMMRHFARGEKSGRRHAGMFTKRASRCEESSTQTR